MKNRPKIEDLTFSASVKLRNPHLFGRSAVEPVAQPAKKPTTRTRFQEPGCFRRLNKTELMARDFLLSLGYEIWGHALRVPLTDGEWYEPDFLARFGGHLFAVEVKGQHVGKGLAWSQRGIEKYKRARAEAGQWFQFIILQRHENQWEIKQ
jgi:Holliday junction resolvase-like predicted endonuclease